MTSQRLERVRARVRKHIAEWRKFHYCGPCYPVSKVLSLAGYGRIARVSAMNQLTNNWYGHYVCVAPYGGILDATGEHLRKAQKSVRYKSMRMANDGEHYAYPERCIEFWQERLGDLI